MRNRPAAEPPTPGRPPNVLRQGQRRCDNPACTNLLEWREQRGRPPRFCSDRCRQQASAALARLQDELERVRRLEAGDVTYRQRRRLNSQRVHIEWLLSAFPRSTTDT